MELKFEKMTKADITQVLDIERKSFTDPWSRDSFENGLKATCHKYFTVKDASDSSIVGFICILYYLTDGDILDIAVKPDKRRQGIGMQALKFAIQHMKDNGVERVLLDVRQSNEPAKALYERLGFEKIAERKNYYKNPTEDAFVMQKTSL